MIEDERGISRLKIAEMGLCAGALFFSLLAPIKLFSISFLHWKNFFGTKIQIGSSKAFIGNVDVISIHHRVYEKVWDKLREWRREQPARVAQI